MMAARYQESSWLLSDLLHDFALVEPQQDGFISGLTLDSREVVEGNLFLACVGLKGHGLDYVQDVVAKGAAAILCEPGGDWPQDRIDALAAELTIPLLCHKSLGSQISALASRFYGDPSRELRVIGVTGTNGKTSCTQFLAQALGDKNTCGVIGTLGSGFINDLKPGRHTTPEPVELQARLAELKAQGAQAVALEVSSHALEQDRVAAVQIDSAILTNLSRDHLDFHGGMEQYAAAKQRLFQHPGLRCAVLNMDDPFGWECLRALPKGVKALGYGLSEPERDYGKSLSAWLWATRIEPIGEGMRIGLATSWGEAELISPLLGRFNVSNQLAVLAVLLERGMGFSSALDRLSELRPVAGRMECFGGAPAQPLVVVDYAHTPDALEQALLTLREVAKGRLICLFGCGGDRDQGKRLLMGAVAERLSDLVILTDDNPRGEDGDRIVADILSGMAAPDECLVIRKRADAISKALEMAQPGDLVLVSGKGHEAYQQVGDLKLPFSDREQVEAILSGGQR